MIPLTIIFCAIFALYKLLALIYNRNWYKGLSAEAYYASPGVFEGQNVELVEKVENNKLLPLPYVSLDYNQSLNLVQLDKSGEPMYYGKERNTVFAVSGRKVMVKRSSLACLKRGYYRMERAVLSTSDPLFSREFTRKLNLRSGLCVYPRELELDDAVIPYKNVMGELLAKRFYLHDPFVFSGIREYQPFDSMKQVNFKAWAKTGELMSNVYGYTQNQQILIALNLQNYPNYRDNGLHEQAIRLAAFLARYYIEENVPVSFLTNGVDCVTHDRSTAQAGLTRSHLQGIYEILARVDVDAEPASILDDLPEEIPDSMVIILISAYRDEKLTRWFTQAKTKDGFAMWVLPCRPGAIAPPGGIIAWEVEND